jgi:tetratricopeptide (TPR) repeat protein
MPAASVSPLASSFVQKNQQVYDRFVTFLDFSPDRFTLGFASINFGRDREALVQAVRIDSRCADLQIEVMDFPDRELRFFKDALVARLVGLERQSGKKLVLVVTGLEWAIGMLGEYPLVLQDLNYVRDAFVHTVPHPIVFLLPDGALTRLAKFAPDLWAWRKGVFEFESSVQVVESAYSETLASGRLDGSLSEVERQARIDLLERLLTDPSQARSVEQEIKLRTELGKHYRDLGDVDKARIQLEQALHLSKEQPDLILVKAKALQELSSLCQTQGEIDCALAYAEESAQISHQSGDCQTEANSLSLIADIQADQGNIDESLRLREKILQLCELGDYFQGKAATLNNMARVIAQQGDIDRALQLWNESLQIKEKIGDVKGKAATLNNLAIVVEQQGDVEQALAFWQESLQIKEKIGDVEGKASTLANMADTLAGRGDFETAIAYLEESIVLLDRIRDIRAQQVRQMLQQVRRQMTKSQQKSKGFGSRSTTAGKTRKP